MAPGTSQHTRVTDAPDERTTFGPHCTTSRTASRLRRVSESIKRRVMIKRISAGLVSAVLLVNVLGCNNSKVRASAPPPPPVVEVAPVIQRTVPVVGEWV